MRAFALSVLTACALACAPADVAPATDAADASSAVDAATPDSSSASSDAFVPPEDASLPPLRDDGISPGWTWIEQARRAIDGDALEAAFAAEGWSPPAGTEIYAARIVQGAGSPAYVLYDAGGGAFSVDYWPASTVKVLSSIAALRFLRDRGFTGGALVTWDSGFGDVARSIVARAIRVSSNEDYDRTIRIAGFDWLNESFLDEAHGFPDVVIQRSYAGFPIRDIPGMRIEEGGASDYVPARSTTRDFGCGSDGNCASLFELTEAVRRIVLDAELTSAERFDLDPADTAALEDALCTATPSFFAAGVERALGHAARICHKPGWVPWNDCLDHGVVEDPETGERYLLAAAVPETAGRTDCLPLADVAEHTLRALRAAPPGMPLQPDAGIAITVQIDPGTITVDAPGAARVELFADGTSIGERTGAGPRFAIDHTFATAGEHLLVVRASAAGTPIGARALRVAIPAP